MMNSRIAIAAVSGFVTLTLMSGTGFAASKCSGTKIKAAGKKAASKLTCHSKAVSKGVGIDSTCLAKAEAKFATTFAKAEAKGYTDAGCLTTGDAAPIEAKVDQFVDEIAASLSGPRFVDNGDGTVTDNQTGLQWEKKTGTVGSSSNICQYASCPAGNTFTGTYTASCGNGTFTVMVSSDGSSWTGTSSAGGSCPAVNDFSGTISGNTVSGTGSSGFVTVSGTLDCGNTAVSGTLGGFTTGSWMATTGASCPDPHDVMNAYGWTVSADTVPNGPAFTLHLKSLNDCVTADGIVETGGFAGHCDWRLPTLTELRTIMDAGAAGCEFGSPCIDPVFGPTVAGEYWSSTSDASDPNYAWLGNFFSANAESEVKSYNGFVRAVRGRL